MAVAVGSLEKGHLGGSRRLIKCWWLLAYCSSAHFVGEAHILNLTVLTAGEADVMEAELCKCSRKEGAVCVLMDNVCVQPCSEHTV